MGDGDGQWHLDKKVPITLIAAILAQTFGFGVWAENLNQRLEEVEKAVPAASESIQKLNEAREDLRLNVQAQVLALNNLSHLLDERTARFNSIQETLARIEGHQREGHNAPSDH